MEMTRRSFALTGLTALTGLALGGTSLSAFAAGKAGTLRYGTVTEVTNIDPHIYAGNSWKVLIGVLYSPLVTFDTKGEIVPAVAESWEQPDAATIVFRLREGVTFHDGSALTADDVVFSLERIRDEATGATLRGYLVDCTIAKVDERTVEVKKSEPDASLLSVLALPEAAMVSKAWVESGVNIKSQANGTGPFTLAEYESGVRARLAANPSYFVEGEPKLKAVDFRMIKSDDARVSALRSGQLDMIDFVPWKDIDMLARMPNFEVDSASGAFMSVWFNATRAPFDDPRVRRAMAFAVDREAISRAAFFGHGTPIFSVPTPPDSPYFNADLKGTVSLDIEKAKALLAEAGHGEGLDMELIVYQGLGIYTTTAQILQANLKEIGVNVSIRLVEWSDLVSRKNGADYDAMIYGVSMKLNDPDAYSYYLGSESAYWAKPIGYRDETLEALLDEGRQLTDQGARKAVYAKAEERILETMPWIFINYREQAQAYTRKVKGYVHLGGALSEAAPAISLPKIALD
ncbi:ABC transporter substrate-binding protein [Stappia indica]|uniref:ABC transporter substrate-binding protein n=1 Tax=Stappia indica TaxID=538381 RepID=UPI001D18560D|nr:ABC transporter substrate-binding protein [Stappia indica]MCC4246491.1 ABC transporter substrate-binding protein [Stappia indica]